MKRSTEGENAAWAGIGAIKSVRDLTWEGGKEAAKSYTFTLPVFKIELQIRTPDISTTR